MGLPACSRNLWGQLMDVPAEPGAGLTREAWQILTYASLAPSGHNSQPWSVRVVSEREWIIGSDNQRWLTVVDPDNREVLLSIGAFIENLAQAASAYGFHAEIEVLARTPMDGDVARVVLVPGKAADIPLARISTRRTVKSKLQPRELTSADVADFTRAAGGHLHYFPAGSRHSNLMAQEAVENFRIQFENSRAMAEAVQWTRFSDKDVKKYRDGLTPDGMEITGLAGFYVRHFLDPADAAGRRFREKGIQKVSAQAKEGGGWLVITSDGATVPDLIRSGRRFQRMALLAREKMVGIHPMTQTLEEASGRSNIRRHHPSAMIPQFMLRVGYLAQYPDPVSLRRPVDWFLVKPSVS